MGGRTSGADIANRMTVGPPLRTRGVLPTITKEATTMQAIHTARILGMPPAGRPRKIVDLARGLIGRVQAPKMMAVIGKAASSGRNVCMLVCSCAWTFDT